MNAHCALSHLMSVYPIQIVEVGHVRYAAMANEYLVVDDRRQGEPAEQILEEFDDRGGVTLNDQSASFMHRRIHGAK